MGKERPILMTPENAQKCFDGTKTQTRRIVKLPHENPLGQWEPSTLRGPGCYADKAMTIPVSEHLVIWHTRTGDCIGCPQGQPGDRLWVREAFAWPGEEVLIYRGNPGDMDVVRHWMARENGPKVKWTPAIHMPRWACRTVLELTEVRVERLQECSEADAIKEGCAPCGHTSFHVDEHTCSYKTLWESINGADSWALNPWVWVLTFRLAMARIIK